MSLALPFVKRQLCSNAHLRYGLVYGRRAQSALMARLVELSKSPSPQPNSATSNTASSTSSGASSGPKKATKKLTGEDTQKKNTPSRNLLEESKIQSYLDHIAETSNTVTLADITRLQPNDHSDPETPEYEEEYNALVDRLCRSFSKKQLHSFIKMLELEGARRKSSKQHHAVHIIEDGWGWPSLAKVKARKRDWSEVLSQSFPLDPRQSFLILGKDGANLHALSNQYNIHIGFTTRPLSLNAEGVRGALKQLEEHIAFVKEDIVEEYQDLSLENPVPPELLHRISRLSGAFTETFGEGKIRISYRRSDPRAAFIAKRLVTHVLCDFESTAGSSILVHIPPDAPLSTPVPSALFPLSYALYPFLSSRSLHWNDNASGAFRARKVAEWIGFNSMEDVQKSGGLELGRGQILDMEENLADIQRQLFTHLPESSEGRSRAITASFGHVLLTPPSSSHASLIPPLKGSWPLSNLLRWIREKHIGRLFTPSLPAAVLRSAPQKTQLLHRLIYEARRTDNGQQATHMLEFEMILPSATVHQDGVSELARPDSNPPHEHIETALNHICRIGNQFVVDLMLPDRPMDIRFSIFDSSVLIEKLWPAELQKYFQDLSFFFHDGEADASPPNAPLILHLQGVEYRLRSSVSVRQTQTHASAPHWETSIPAITESVLDLEVDDKSTLCKITCNEPFTDVNWRAFLKGCDFLSGLRVPTSNNTFVDTETDITL
ncbi:hypothetical protein F5050DRAFT_1727364 [Lentinula boryana]|uniref:K Homology domain-containing protein n=1 Tax=Lentinula boryana TaxID=40481 RepID=A0ABQ8QRD5_9AGAR|nr:hypothetical protein F5050DRAFT_1727364 [Lentinula boryana]